MAMEAERCVASTSRRLRMIRISRVIGFPVPDPEFQFPCCRCAERPENAGGKASSKKAALHPAINLHRPYSTAHQLSVRRTPTSHAREAAHSFVHSPARAQYG